MGIQTIQTAFAPILVPAPLLVHRRGESTAAPGDGGLFLQTGAATTGGLPWATAATVRERGTAAAAAPGVTAH